MDIESISVGLRMVYTTLNTLEKIKNLIPKGPDKQDLERKIEEVEINLKIAETEIAKGFGYKLCRRHFPPGIMLDLDEFKLKCSTCGVVEDFG